MCSSDLGGRLADLNVQRRSAKEQLANQLATQQAQDFAQARAAALNAALGGQQQYYGQNMGYLDRLMNYGQQGFQNAMTQAEFNRLLQNDQDQMMLRMLGLA